MPLKYILSWAIPSLFVHYCCLFKTVDSVYSLLMTGYECRSLLAEVTTLPIAPPTTTFISSELLKQQKVKRVYGSVLSKRF